MVRDSRKVAVLLCVKTVGGVLIMLDLAEVKPGFPRIGTSRSGVDNHRRTSRAVMMIHGLLAWRIGRLGTSIQ